MFSGWGMAGGVTETSALSFRTWIAYSTDKKKPSHDFPPKCDESLFGGKADKVLFRTGLYVLFGQAHISGILNTGTHSPGMNA